MNSFLVFISTPPKTQTVLSILPLLYFLLDIAVSSIISTSIPFPPIGGCFSYQSMVPSLQKDIIAVCSCGSAKFQISTCNCHLKFFLQPEMAEEYHLPLLHASPLKESPFPVTSCMVTQNLPSFGMFHPFLVTTPHFIGTL